ncbi:MAG TPA: MarR family transcriptional regulator [Vineibacter sp.]|nr:MarR family transcriptional regulator [Vineibacter sp.]
MAKANGPPRRAVPGKSGVAAPPSAPARASDAVSIGPMAEFIGFHLRKAQNASFQAFARRVGQTALSPGTFAVLTLIQHNPGISQTALSRADGRDKSSLTPALNALERHGLILRQRLPANRRTYALNLTPAGEKVLAELTRHAEAHDRSLDRIVGAADKPRLIRLLRRIATELVGDTTDEDVLPSARTTKAGRASGRNRAPRTRIHRQPTSADDHG